MKKAEPQKLSQRVFKISRVRLKVKEMKTFQASVNLINEQANQLGLLDPLDAEPAIIYFPEEEKR